MVSVAKEVQTNSGIMMRRLVDLSMVYTSVFYIIWVCRPECIVWQWGPSRYRRRVITQHLLPKFNFRFGRTEPFRRSNQHARRVFVEFRTRVHSAIDPIRFCRINLRHATKALQ